MQTETKVSVAVDVDAQDVFVLVLTTKNQINAEICGRTIINWVDSAVAKYKRTSIEIKRNDDIIGLVRENVKDEKYCVVVYGDTPLLQQETIEQALSFAATYGHKVVQLSRGWVFDMEDLKGETPEIKPAVCPNLEEVDFTIAYNYQQVATITTYARQRINEAHMQNGVQITDPYNVYIDVDAKIGAGTKIGPGVVLRGACDIGKNCRITNYVEIKKSKIGDGTKISHMTYVGDAEVGSNCNLGCGIVFCNYDGKNKHKTIVGNNCFIGSNCNLVAPVTIGDNAFVAAGSTITQDVPADALALARARQAIKEGWVSAKNSQESE